ncbi:stress-responsive transcription factor hsf1 [Mortierella sp. AD031]|nr:stress-responsive transcription factor hsf1 [Mortierella sp. AD031]
MMFSSNDPSNNPRIVELSTNSPLSIATNDNATDSSNSSPKPIITTPGSANLPFMPSPSLSDYGAPSATVMNPVSTSAMTMFNNTPQQQQQQQQQQMFQLQQLQLLQQQNQQQQLQFLQQYQQLQNAGDSLGINAALAALNSHTSTNVPASSVSSAALQPVGATTTQTVNTVARPANTTATKSKGRSGALASSGITSPSTSQSLQPLARSTNNGARANVTTFLTKLYNMVGNPASNDLIRWSDDGDSFIVTDQVRFAKEVLPKFFKHNLFTSFVRQLNMYDFHKVPHLQQGVLMPDSDSEHCEFSNPHFQRDQPDLLHLVARKKASSAANNAKGGQDDLMSSISNSDSVSEGRSTGRGGRGGAGTKDALTLDLGHIVQEVNAIKRHQVAISTDLRNIERDHQSLWQESIAARERHQRQQETIDKILRFLASVFSGEKKRAIVPNKKTRLTITDGETARDRDSGLSNAGRLVEAEDEDEVEELDEDDGAEEIGLSGSKRKRSQLDDGNDSQKPAYNISELTPDTLAMLSSTKQKQQQKPVATTTNATSTAGLRTIPTLSSATNFTSPQVPDYLLPGLLNYAQQNARTNNTADIKTALGGNGGGGFQFDPSNLTLPTTLLPNVLTSPAHHDMLRSISMANARDTTHNAQSLAPPLPPPNPSALSSALSGPAFSQTPAGAHVTKGVDQITMDMERLQQSLDALSQHGLNIENFDLEDDFDGGGDDAYLHLANPFDTTTYPDLGSSFQDAIGEYNQSTTSFDPNQFTQQQDFMNTRPVAIPSGSNATTTTSAVPAWSNNNNSSSNFHVGANPRITTVGEDGGLEELLDIEPS